MINSIKEERPGQYSGGNVSKDREKDKNNVRSNRGAEIEMMIYIYIYGGRGREIHTLKIT